MDGKSEVSSVEMSRGLGSHVPPPSSAPGPCFRSSRTESTVTFYRDKQKNTLRTGTREDGGGEWGRDTGCCFVFRFLFSCLFPRSDPVAGAQSTPPPPPCRAQPSLPHPLVAHISLSPFLYGSSTKSPWLLRPAEIFRRKFGLFSLM